MELKLISLKQASEMLGVCKETLRNWDRSGKLIAKRTLGGSRRYRLEDIMKLVGDSQDER